MSQTVAKRYRACTELRSWKFSENKGCASWLYLDNKALPATSDHQTDLEPQVHYHSISLQVPWVSNLQNGSWCSFPSVGTNPLGSNVLSFFPASGWSGVLLQGDEATADPVGTVGTKADMAIEVRFFSGDFSKVICASAWGSHRLPLPSWPSLDWGRQTQGFLKSGSRSGKLFKILLHFYVLCVNVSVQGWAWNTSERKCGWRSEGSLWKFVLSFRQLCSEACFKTSGLTASTFTCRASSPALGKFLKARIRVLIFIGAAVGYS